MGVRFLSLLPFPAFFLFFFSGNRGGGHERSPPALSFLLSTPILNNACNQTQTTDVGGRGIGYHQTQFPFYFWYMKIVVSSSTVLNKKLLFLLARGEKKVKKEAKSRWGSISSYSLSLPPSCFQAATILPSPSPRLNAANYSSLLFLSSCFQQGKEREAPSHSPAAAQKRQREKEKRRGGGEKGHLFCSPPPPLSLGLGRNARRASFSLFFWEI